MQVKHAKAIQDKNALMLIACTHGHWRRVRRAFSKRCTGCEVEIDSMLYAHYPPNLHVMKAWPLNYPLPRICLKTRYIGWWTLILANDSASCRYMV